MEHDFKELLDKAYPIVYDAYLMWDSIDRHRPFPDDAMLEHSKNHPELDWLNRYHELFGGELGSPV